MMSVMRRRFACLLSAVLIASGGLGCGQNEADREVRPALPEAPSPWQSNGDGWRIALPEHAQDEELADVIAQARLTASDARERWLKTPESERDNWAVKWAAPLDFVFDENNDDDVGGDGEYAAVEHVWVRPLHWSPFRIEGVLISDPVNKLHKGRVRGDLVSFPIEELSDWVHFIDGDAQGRREGGFTIDALEAKYGKPPPM